jgi:epoxyqueuosine reductase
MHPSYPAALGGGSMSIDQQLKDLSLHHGIDYFGVAGLTQAYNAVLDQGGPEIAQYPRAISIGIALPHSIVNQLPSRTERAVAMMYRHHAYDVINERLDIVTSRLTSILQQAGHGVFPVPATKTTDPDRLCGVFSNKLAAHLAGLGWIGKSCLLITPSAGPRVRWATVLTDAPITETGERMAERCGDCMECVKICPMQAFTGEPFRENEPREVRYNAGKCSRYFEKMKEKDPELAVCGLCLYRLLKN